jgi:hypothetical protein
MRLGNIDAGFFPFPAKVHVGPAVARFDGKASRSHLLLSAFTLFILSFDLGSGTGP